MPASILLGDVFRAFNPWRALGRTVAWVSQTAAREPLPAPLAYPDRLGYLPAAAGLFAFTALELVASNGSEPKNVAIATLVYSAVTFVAMALYGVEAWIARGEAFSVYLGLFARISPWTWRAGRLGLRKPRSALAGFRPLPGSVLVLAMMIGTVSFDGAAEAPILTKTVPHVADAFIGLCAGFTTFVLWLLAQSNG